MPILNAKEEGSARLKRSFGITKEEATKCGVGTTTVVDDRHKAYCTVHKNQFLSAHLTSRKTQISRRAVIFRF